MNKKGSFIAFEGIDGSGKTTQLKLLAERVKACGGSLYETREPTDGLIGSLIRGLLKGESAADERTIALLFAADRFDHLTRTGGICEMLTEGINVITDRYYLSSYAYQSAVMPLSWVIEINSQSAALLKPDCHIFIDVKPETAIERITGGRGETELFETLGRLTDVRKKYFEIFDMLKGTENIIIIDGGRTPEAVAESVWDSIGILYE